MNFNWKANICATAFSHFLSKALIAQPFNWFIKSLLTDLLSLVLLMNDQNFFAQRYDFGSILAEKQILECMK